MHRLDRALLKAANLAHQVEITIRFDDIDVQGHVNNAAGVVLLQEARVAFNDMVGATSMKGLRRPIVAALHVEYAEEIHYPGSVTVCTGVLRIGRSSVVLGQVASRDGRPCLYGTSALVFVDTAGPVPVGEELRAAYHRFLIQTV